jgi:hypothetical protein
MGAGRRFSGQNSQVGLVRRSADDCERAWAKVTVGAASVAVTLAHRFSCSLAYAPSFRHPSVLSVWSIAAVAISASRRAAAVRDLCPLSFASVSARKRSRVSTETPMSRGINSSGTLFRSSNPATAFSLYGCSYRLTWSPLAPLGCTTVEATTIGPQAPPGAGGRRMGARRITRVRLVRTGV